MESGPPLWFLCCNERPSYFSISTYPDIPVKNALGNRLVACLTRSFHRICPQICSIFGPLWSCPICSNSRSCFAQFLGITSCLNRSMTSCHWYSSFPTLTANRNRNDTWLGGEGSNRVWVCVTRVWALFCIYYMLVFIYHFYNVLWSAVRQPMPLIVALAQMMI